MRCVNISELKKSLSAVLEFVRAGSVVVVYDRKTPVARVVPINKAATDTKEANREILEALERSGAVLRGGGEQVRELLSEPPIPKNGGDILSALNDEREDRL